MATRYSSSHATGALKSQRASAADTNTNGTASFSFFVTHRSAAAFAALKAVMRVTSS